MKSSIVRVSFLVVGNQLEEAEQLEEGIEGDVRDTWGNEMEEANDRGEDIRK
jgi:hypothetical protein